MTIFIDHSHVGRLVTGLERITLELFSAQALRPLQIVPITARGLGSMVLCQQFGLPGRAMLDPSSIVLCPGFPPSPLMTLFGARVIPYVHDVFLLTRPRDLNARAKLYMVPSFAFAIGRLPRFFVNSEETRRRLMHFARSDAEILLYRPRVRNLFDLDSGDRAERGVSRHFRLVAIGTVEPRKNFLAAARIAAALRNRGFDHLTLEIIGRAGWGDDYKVLSSMPGVVLHGYQEPKSIRAILHQADAFICTSHEEGLGLPLLEAQYAGLPVIAPDQLIFREVLGASGIFIDALNSASAADYIVSCLTNSDWRRSHVQKSAQNLARWNALADADRDNVISLLHRLQDGRMPITSQAH